MNPDEFDTVACSTPQRRHILYLAHRLPYPPDKGDRIRSWHVVSHLTRRHDLSLACFADEPPRPEHVAALERTCRDVAIVPFDFHRARTRAALSLVMGRSFSRAAYADPWMRAIVARWSSTRRFDAVIALSSVMAPYALAVPAARRILDFCDCDSAKWSDYAARSAMPTRWLWRREARRLRAEERRWAESADATVLITERERQELHRPARPPRTIADILDAEHRKLCARTLVIPNGVRVPAYSGTPAESLGPIVGFVGAMDYRPNVDGIVWFVGQVWPQIRSARPEAQLIIIGRNPSRRVRRLDGRHGITVTGTVSNVADRLHRIRVGVAPLQIARGIPNKVLEMLAARRPVVATSAVAACLARAAASAIRICDDSAIFAHEVVSLLNDDDACRRAAEAGRQFVLARHAWEPGLRAFEALVTGDSAGCEPARGQNTARREIHPRAEIAGRPNTAASTSQSLTIG